MLLIKRIGSILSPSNAYIDRYYRPIYRPIPVACRSSVDRCKVSVKHRSSIGQVSVKYRSSIGQVSVNRQVYRPIGVSVDTSVGTRPIYRPVLDRISTDTRSSIDRCIERCIGRHVGRGPP